MTSHIGARPRARRALQMWSATALRKPLLLVLALAACGEEPRGAQPTESAARLRVAPVQPALGELPGLYESSGTLPDQLCIHAADGELRFGIVTHGAGLRSCSGTGALRRHGAGLRLEMGGSASCALDAKIEGSAIVLPASVAASCAYYCSAGASLANRRLQLRQAGEEGAVRAKDLVGDPLCHKEES